MIHVIVHVPIAILPHKMPIKLSNDLLWHVIYLNNVGKSPEQISLLLFVSKTTVTRTLTNYRKWRHVRNPFIGQQGQHKRLNYSEMNVRLHKYCLFYTNIPDINVTIYFTL